jgi:hypothetical protein
MTQLESNLMDQMCIMQRTLREAEAMISRILTNPRLDLDVGTRGSTERLHVRLSELVTWRPL